MNIGVHRLFWIGVSGFVGYSSRDHQLTPYTRINLKWIRDLNISPDTIKVLGGNLGRKISHISLSNIFTDISPRARDIKERINKWDYIKLKSYCMAKEDINKMGRDPTIWKNIFANDTWDKGLISKIYKELTQLIPGRQAIQLKNGQRTWTDTSPRRTYRGPIVTWKKCSTSLAIREMQIKTTMRDHFTPVRIAVINSQQTTSAGEVVEKREPEYTVGGNADCCSHCGKY